jgi:hypothetical protein
MDPFTLVLVLLMASSCVVALPALAEAYRFLTRGKRKAATRARLARLPLPEEALKDADGDEIVAYLRELFGNPKTSDGLRDEEIKARFEEVVRIVKRRERSRRRSPA